MTPGTFNGERVPLDHYPRLGYALIRDEAVVYCDLAGGEHCARVGMPFDGLTIPRFFWRLAGPPMRTPLLQAGAVHDDYCFRALAVPAGVGRDALRLEGDRLFREMVSVLGAGDVEAWYLFRSVRLGAWAARNDPIRPHYIEEYEAFMAWYVTTLKVVKEVKPQLEVGAGNEIHCDI